jgi:hypothetical protein
MANFNPTAPAIHWCWLGRLIGEDNVLAWSASDAVGGSPGKLDPITGDP